MDFQVEANHGIRAAQPQGLRAANVHGNGPVSLTQDPDVVELSNQKPKPSRPSPWYVRWGKEALKIGVIVGASTLGAMVGGVPGAIVAGAAISGLVSVYDQKSAKGTVDFGTVGIDALIGAIPGGFGSAVGKIGGRLVAPFVKAAGAQAVSKAATETVGRAVAKAAFTGAVDGGAMGYAAGFAHTTYNTYQETGNLDLSAAHQAGTSSVLPGMIGGALIAGGITGVAKRFHGKTTDSVTESKTQPTETTPPAQPHDSAIAPEPKAGAVGDEAVDPLIQKGRELREAWAQSMGLNPERLGPMSGNEAGLLPAMAGGGNVSAMNEVYLNTPMIKEGGIYHTIAEFTAHEGAHNYLANTRTAFARQLPDVFQADVRKVILNATRKGEQGKVVKSMGFHLPKSGQYADQIAQVLEAHPNLTPSDRHHVALWLEEVLVDYNNRIYKAHKYDTPRLDASALSGLEKDLVPKLEGCMAKGGYGAHQEAAQALRDVVDAQMPQLLKVRQNMLKDSINRRKTPVMVDVPQLSRQERTHAARFLEKLLDHPEAYLEAGDLPGMRQLNARAVVEAEQTLMPKLDDFLKQFHPQGQEPAAIVRQQAFGEIRDYLDAQVYRHDLLREHAIVPRNEQLPSATQVPLTPRETRHARASLRGYLQTVEGNAQIQSGDYSNAARMNYTFAWEELRARQTASRFRLRQTRRRVEDLTAQGKEPAACQELAEAMKLQKKLQSDMRLLKHAREYMALERKLAMAPKNPKTLRALRENVLQQQRLKASIQEAEAKSHRLMDEASNQATHLTVAQGVKESSFIMPPEFNTLRKSIDQMNTELGGLEVQHRKLSSLEALLSDTPQKQALISARQRALEGMRRYAHQSTLNPLPSSVYRSGRHEGMHQGEMQEDLASLLKNSGLFF